ncbi:hypothetical protein Pmani_040052 [Petrolisthes manimaculis]|uniref:Uncharacterized protein n=1 Tax=Petrolisthes manimaculis TaxID=1843537 RepID=A0AAE1NCX8_9EUCA|nr:hypothetical protein Pmani_040052 [Petrolisthes manimaculis]
MSPAIAGQHRNYTLTRVYHKDHHPIATTRNKALLSGDGWVGLASSLGRRIWNGFYMPGRWGEEGMKRGCGVRLGTKEREGHRDGYGVKLGRAGGRHYGAGENSGPFFGNVEDS